MLFEAHRRWCPCRCRAAEWPRVPPHSCTPAAAACITARTTWEGLDNRGPKGSLVAHGQLVAGTDLLCTSCDPAHALTGVTCAVCVEPCLVSFAEQEQHDEHIEQRLFTPEGVHEAPAHEADELIAVGPRPRLPRLLQPPPHLHSCIWRLFRRQEVFALDAERQACDGCGHSAITSCST